MTVRAVKFTITITPELYDVLFTVPTMCTVHEFFRLVFQLQKQCTVPNNFIFQILFLFQFMKFFLQLTVFSLQI